MSLQIRRGTEAERLSITPLTAELIYTTDTQLVYVGDGVTAGGILVGSGGGNGNYGNANVVALLNSGLAGNIIPTVDNFYSLGNSTNQWADLYVSNSTIYMNNVPLSANATTLSYDGVALVPSTGTANITTTGDISAGNMVGNGSRLSSITGANVIGTVASATFANNSGIAATATTALVAQSVAGANVTGTVASAIVAASANSVAAANIVGAVTTAVTAGTVTTAAQPNITSVGTLTSLAMSGNINAGTNVINNLAEPVQGQDAATKAYVDARSSGLSVKASVVAATAVPLGVTYTYNNGVAGVGAYILATTVGQLTIDGVAVTVGSRVLIKNEVGAYVDDTTPSAAFNGIYVVLDDGVLNAFQLERTTDCDTSTEIPAAYTLVTGGSTLTNTGWVADNQSTMTVGTTEINFDQFSAVTTYSGGDAIDVIGTVINALYDGTTITTNGFDQLTVGTVPGTSISGTVASATVAASANAVAGANVSGQVANALVAGTVYTAAQPNITSVGTLVDLTVTGNVTGDYFIGNGSQLTGLPSGYSNADVSTYLASGTDTAGIVTTGNISGNYILGDGSQLTNLPPASAVSIPAVYFDVTADGNNQTFSNSFLSAYTSNTEITLFYNGALLDSPYYTFSGDTLTINTELQTGDSIDVIRQFASNVIVSTYSNSTVAAYLASGNNTSNIITTGNISGDYFIGNGSQLTGLPSGYSNADVSTYLASGTDTAGIVTTGNVTANRIAATTFSGDGGLITNITGGYVIGDVANAAYATIAGSAATVYDNAQPNITSVGTLVDLTSSGNITVGTGAFFIGDGGLLSNISGAGDYSNANVANYLPTYTGDLANVNMANSLGVLMGTPTQGALASNAVTLTTTTALTNGIALLNQVLGKLVPPAPPAFPASQTLSVAGLATYRMANSSQTDNVPGGGSTVAPGTTVTSVKRTAAYATNTITTAGPGDSGTVTALRNGVAAGSVALTGSSNGTYGNLVITNNQDYNVSNSSIAPGFWSVFSSALSGTVPAGWNSAQITDTAAGSTNTVKWYYDASAPGTPQFTSVTMTPPGSPTVIYSSTVPHYTNVNQFAIGYTVNRLSGDMYPTSDTFATGTAAGAFAAPVSVTYQTSSLGTNVLTSNATATVSTTSTVISGFGSSATAPTLSVVNSYATGTQVLTAILANTVLYKTGTASTMEETNLVIGSPIGSGTGPAFRIVSPGATDTPVFSANEPAFNSQTSTLQTYDATIVAAILKHDQTNYSTGYLPAGPNLSVGRGAAQYFTFKFVRTATSKFDIRFSGTIAGMWIALPGSVIDTASTLNGWIDASVNYAGSGVPGASIAGGGNGSNGCGLGSTAPLNTLSTNVSTTCTFGTASSSSTASNEIYVRIKLTAGQTVTALSLQTGSR